MLSYPLCPFFVVFCNVVGTSNARDFELLQDVTNGISTLITENKYVSRLHRLCSTLLSLCKPLVQRMESNGDVDVSNSGTAAVNNPSSVFGLPPHGLDVTKGNESADEFLPSSWNDDMMWQLFQSQPSLDWFNADILDPAWDVNLPK